MERSITHEVNWDTLKWQLQAPFDPADVDFRIQGKANPNTGKAQVLAYIDARAVQERLDEVVGPQNWSFDWSPVSVDGKGDIVAAKGTLTIYGIAKSDVGDASNFDGNKGAVSGAEKRAAVQWGIGRYLYEIEKTWVKVGSDGLSPETLQELRKRLPRPKTDLQALNPGSTLERVNAFQQIVDSTNPMAVQRVPVEPTEADWKALKVRMFKSKLATNPAQFEAVMEQTGGDYAEVLAKVEAIEQHDLRATNTARSRKGVH